MYVYVYAMGWDMVGLKYRTISGYMYMYVMYSICLDWELSICFDILVVCVLSIIYVEVKWMVAFRK